MGEVMKLKKRILKEINENGIQIYQLPDADDDEDEDFKEQTRCLKESIPFAVVGSTQMIEVKGKSVRGRLYPWGVVEVENPDHCDFLKLSGGRPPVVQDETMSALQAKDEQIRRMQEMVEKMQAQMKLQQQKSPPKSHKV